MARVAEPRQMLSRTEREDMARKLTVNERAFLDYVHIEGAQGREVRLDFGINSTIVLDLRAGELVRLGFTDTEGIFAKAAEAGRQLAAKGLLSDSDDAFGLTLKGKLVLGASHSLEEERRQELIRLHWQNL